MRRRRRRAGRRTGVLEDDALPFFSSHAFLPERSLMTTSEPLWTAQLRTEKRKPRPKNEEAHPSLFALNVHLHHVPPALPPSPPRSQAHPPLRRLFPSTLLLLSFSPQHQSFGIYGTYSSSRSFPSSWTFAFQQPSWRHLRRWIRNEGSCWTFPYGI